MNLPDGLLFIPISLHAIWRAPWLSGMMVTLFVIHRLEWVSTFEDSRYLRD